MHIGIMTLASTHRMPYVLIMFFVCVAMAKCIQYIIYKHYHKLIQARFENPIHVIRKCCQGICKPKRHHYKFIMFEPGAEYSLRYVAHP